MNDWEVTAYHGPWHHGVSIMISQIRNGKRFVVKPMDMVLVEYEAGVQVEPSFRISSEAAPGFMAALAESLDKSGVKTDKDATIAGTLKAQSFHLEDLRRLLNLTK